MAQKVIQGSMEFAKTIKQRRQELNLTIEEAASIAGVGTKTWSRYESGASIRKDKGKGICKALNWSVLPMSQDLSDNPIMDFDNLTKHEAWSSYLDDMFGKYAAASFAIGSDILLDHLNEDMNELSSMSRGTHIGQLNISWLNTDLPSQFIMRYDYDFLYILHAAVLQFRLQASHGTEIVAHRVIDELALYLIVEEARFLMESAEIEVKNDDKEDYVNWDDWISEIFGDTDLTFFLYSNHYIGSDSPYHFEHWLERQFYCN